MKRRTKLVLLSLVALLGLAAVINELVFIFPLTPLFLDTAGETRFPATPGRVRVVMVGDVLLADAAQGVIADRGHDHVLGATRQLLQGADLAVGNLEGPISRGGQQRVKRWSYRMDPAAARALHRAGFDLMNLANNHIRDTGQAGVSETISHLREAAILPFGAGDGEAAAHAPAVRKVRGVTVGLLAYMTPHMTLDGQKSSMAHHCWARGSAGAACGHADRVARDVVALRREADVVIVSFHMGDRYQRGPTDWERALCHRAIDAGAHAVVNHGTHILGPVERHRGRPILHGLGNFAFGSGNVLARFSLAALLEIDARKKSLRRVQLLPLYTVNHNPWIRFQAKVLTGWMARRVLGRLTEMSAPLAAPLVLHTDPLRVSLDVKVDK